MHNCLSNSNLSPINTVGWFVYRTPIISKPEMELNMTGLSQAGGPGGHVPPHFLSDQLTLSQPRGGGHIIPSQNYVPPPGFSELATAL